MSTSKCASSFNCLSVPPPSPTSCVTGHADGGVRVWDTKTGSLALDLPGLHSGHVTCVRCHPGDASVVFSMGKDNVVRAVDLRVCKAFKSLGHVDFRVGMNWAGFAVSPDGRYAAAGGVSGDLFVWEVEGEKVAVKLKGHRAAVSGVSWGAGENQVASVDKDGSLVFWQ